MRSHLLCKITWARCQKLISDVSLENESSSRGAETEDGDPGRVVVRLATLLEKWVQLRGRKRLILHVLKHNYERTNIYHTGVVYYTYRIIVGLVKYGGGAGNHARPFTVCAAIIAGGAGRLKQRIKWHYGRSTR